ncbi:MAG TPA: c-type cytochrome [Flavisolibacter sp.]|nr:c-type cytochrome [Flavisolibacter sp.]
MTKTSLVVLVLVCVVAVSSAFTRATNDPGYKNLQILPKNITEKQLDSVMHHFTASLNVKCNFCHVKQEANPEEWDWASDKNKHKLVARDMMKMTNKLNDEYFPYSGKAEEMSTILTVTCYTCHNGRKEPETRPKKEN